MTEISYAGDENADAMKWWAAKYGVDEVIILISSFDTDSKGGDSSQNPYDIYTGWQWILDREKKGEVAA